MTETAHQAASNPLPADGPDKPASVGLPTGVEIRVVAADGTPATTGDTGEVWVRGAAVITGYRDNPAANAESFTDGWFHTGDLGSLDRDGRPSVEEALSFAVPDEKYGEEIHAAIILRPGHTATEDQLKDYLQDRLSAFEVPKRFHFVEDFPRTPKGTGDRRRLAATLTAATAPIVVSSGP